MNKRRQILSIILALMLSLGLCTPALAYDMGKIGTPNIISAGISHAAVVDENGVLWMWGDNTYGQLGNGTNDDSLIPVKVLDNVVSVACGDNHTAAIKTDGSLWMWGSNYRGALGNGNQGDANTTDDPHGEIVDIQTVPVKVMDNVVAVSCGAMYAAAIKTDGSLWMWGTNDNNEQCNGRQGNATDKYGRPYQTDPIKVMDDVAAVSCGSGFTAIINTDGSLCTWGWNYYGQLGNGRNGIAGRQTVLDNVAAVSCGGHSHLAAITMDGILRTCGNNENGRLGNGSTSTSYTLVEVLEDIVDVSCGYSHTAAVTSDGVLMTWGYNGVGALGDGTINDSFSPVPIMYDVAAVSCGSNYTIALKTDGSLWTWGYNSDGQLGNGGTGNATGFNGAVIQTVPIQITLGDGASMPKGNNNAPVTTDVPDNTNMPDSTNAVVWPEDEDGASVSDSGFPVALVATSLVIVVTIVVVALGLKKKKP